MSKLGFFLSWLHIGWDLEFSSNIDRENPNRIGMVGQSEQLA